MHYYTENFDNKLDSIEIYQQYPLLKPFVGSDYGTIYPKILLRRATIFRAKAQYISIQKAGTRDQKKT